jgi:hypothetical protein
MTTETLKISKKIRLPMFGTWKWSEEDYNTPLIFPLSGANAYLYLDPYDSGKREREHIWHAKFELHFSPVPANYKKGVSTSGKHSTDLANVIYEHYTDVFRKLEALLLSVGGVKSLLTESPTRFESFFENDTFDKSSVKWSLDGSAEKEFKPKTQKDRRKINPLFKREQLIDKTKWKKLQEAIHDQNIPQYEVIEILKIRSILNWRQKKIAVIEASILIETVLRGYIQSSLIGFGFSKTKIKSIKDEITFNSMLNLIVPLTMTKSESKNIQKQLIATNALRKIRNDLVHGNITEDQVEEQRIKDGIDGALKVIAILSEKTKV